MFKKHDFSSKYFKKGDMSNNFKKLGNFHTLHNPYPMVKAGDFDLKEVRRAGNALEKYHK